VSAPRCTGVILAGGLATRYDGRPKGLEMVGGTRIIDRVAAALAETADEILLIANTPEAASWLPGVRTAADVLPGHGSLGGIHAALAHAGTSVLVVAWDMPFVPAELLSCLRALGARADAAVPESDSRRGLEPLCAWYSHACLAPIERRLQAGDRRVVSFFDDVRVARLAADEVRQFGDPELMFLNVNTPDELAKAEAHAAADHGRRA
jgi:molybdopterin-guanine dinucleotide biosynthesis protein A